MRVLLHTPTLAMLAGALLAGCASTKDQVIPSGGPTMLEIYRAHQMQSGVVERPGAELRRPPHKETAQDQGHAADDGVAGPPALAAYAREEAAVLDQRFARLPNPDLVMYVFPHLAPSGVPVPGYVTVLPMYERTQYALPGEIAPSARALDGGR